MGLCPLPSLSEETSKGSNIFARWAPLTTSTAPRRSGTAPGTGSCFTISMSACCCCTSLTRW